MNIYVLKFIKMFSWNFWQRKILLHKTIKIEEQCECISHCLVKETEYFSDFKTIEIDSKDFLLCKNCNRVYKKLDSEIILEEKELFENIRNIRF